MLDNVPHIKAFWIATGVETAQLALWFGADDLDGTVQEESIYHMAGSRHARGDDHHGDPPPDPHAPAASRSSATRSTTSSPAPERPMRFGQRSVSSGARSRLRADRLDLSGR